MGCWIAGIEKFEEGTEATTKEDDVVTAGRLEGPSDSESSSLVLESDSDSLEDELSNITASGIFSGTSRSFGWATETNVLTSRCCGNGQSYGSELRLFGLSNIVKNAFSCR